MLFERWPRWKALTGDAGFTHQTSDKYGDILQIKLKKDFYEMKICSSTANDPWAPEKDKKIRYPDNRAFLIGQDKRTI